MTHIYSIFVSIVFFLWNNFCVTTFTLAAKYNSDETFFKKITINIED